MPKINDPVLIPRLGKGIFVIVGENARSREFTVRDTSGNLHDIYQVHCSRLPVKEHMAFKKAQAEKKALEAEKIGRSKR